MRRFVLDASVSLRWFLDSPVPAYAGRVKELMLAGDRAIVPSLWHVEMASGLAVAERRRVMTAADMERALTDMERLLSQWIESDAALISSRQAVTTARAFGLSVYDAVYLDVARRKRLPLATLDAALQTAAATAGVALFAAD